MGMLFAPDWAVWLAGALSLIVVVGLFLMPKEERRRLLRPPRRSRATARTSVDLGSSLPTGPGHSIDLAGDSTPVVSSRSIGRLENVALVARVLVFFAAVAVVALLGWMVIAFLTSLPGWS